MSGSGNIQALPGSIMPKPQAQERATGDRITVCEQLSRVPTFPAFPNGRPVVLTGVDPDGEEYELHLGAVDKFEAVQSSSDRLCPDLGIEHAVLLFALISFWFDREFGEETISPGMRKLWERYSGSQRAPGGHTYKAFLRLLRDLDECRFKVIKANEPTAGYNLFETDTEHVTLFNNPDFTVGSRLTRFRFHPVFLEKVVYAKMVREIRLDVLRSIKGSIARALYLWLPSRAARSTETKPFMISLEKLFEQLGHRKMRPSERRREIQRTETVARLNGASMLDSNLKLRVQYEEDMFYAWCENGAGEAPAPAHTFNLNSKLAHAYLASGKSSDEYCTRIKSGVQLNDYELSLLAAARIERLDTSIEFFRMAKSLFNSPADFVEILAEAKGFAIEGNRPRKSYGARLRTVVLNRLADQSQAKLSVPLAVNR